MYRIQGDGMVQEPADSGGKALQEKELADPWADDSPPEMAAQ